MSVLEGVAVAARPWPLRPPAVRSVLAHAGILTLAACGAWIAFASATDGWILDFNINTEPKWMYGPLAGLLPPLRDPSFSWLLLAMLAGYALAVAFADALPERLPIWVAAGLIVLFGLAPPLLSSDIFGYVAYARLEVLHGLSPYVHAAAAAPRDPVYPLVYWTAQTSPYGPLFTLLSTPLAIRSIPFAVWSLKALSAACGLLAVALLVRAARACGRSPGRAALIAGANPLLVVYGVGGGHNDLIVMAVVSGALLLLARPGHDAAAGAAFAIATGLKVSGALLAPFAFVASRRRSRFVLGAAATGTVIAIATVAVFGPHLGGTLASIGTSNDFVIDWSGPDALGRALGTGVTTGVRLACAFAAAPVVLLCLWRVSRGADWLSAAAIAGVAVLLAIPTLIPWYVAWVLPAGALARGQAARVAIIAITAALVVNHLPILGLWAY
jgi:alpha-1,6-mannosyltransferase